VLALVEGCPEISSAELARRSQVTAQTMKDVVRNLERAGLVERSAHPEHGRILTLRITERGKAMLDRCGQLVGQVERLLLAPLRPAERAAFIDHLLRAGDSLLAAASTARPPTRGTTG
jgi:DNA-binding MarR family transcriptional regulator